MTGYDVVQAGVIGVAVLASSVYALGRLAPGLRARLAARLLRSSWRPVQLAGSRLSAGGSGCGGGCSSCGGCGPAPEKKLIPVKSAR